MSNTLDVILDTLPIAINFAVAVCIDDQFRLIQSNIGVLHCDIIISKIHRFRYFQIIPTIFDIIGMRVIFIGIRLICQVQILQQFICIITIDSLIEVADVVLVYLTIGGGHIICIYCSLGFYQGLCSVSSSANIIVLDAIQEFCFDGITTIFHVIGLVGTIGILLQSLRRGLQPHFPYKVSHLISIDDSRLSITNMSSTLDIILDTLPITIDLAVAICIDD